MYSPTDPISSLAKAGPKLVQKLLKANISSIGQLLMHFPTRYLDFAKFSTIQTLTAGELVTIRGTIKSIAARFSFATKKNLTEALISDATGFIKVTWFNQGYIAETLKKGDEVLLSGKATLYKNTLELHNPVYEKVATEQLHTGRLVPVYKLPEGVFPKAFRALMHQALPTAKLLEESIPETIRTKYKLPSIADCITQLHFPDNGDTITHAQRRLAFEEGLVQQLAVELHKQALRKLAAPSIPKEEEYQLRELESKLPFNLTRGQQDALLSIFHDLQYKHPMNRLLQGDVGSGKTIVALLAARAVTAAGYQVALLAPTEILAKQHYDSLLNQLEILGIKKEKVGLLTRNFRYIANTPVTKKQFLEHVQDVSDLLIIGTHALLQEEATFSNLGLVIIDEQHRFGIAQRQALIAPTKAKHSTKRQKNRRYPHLLSMSATPIPRTAALALFGDLEISTIQELPKKRLPIKTWLVPEEKRTGAYGFIKTQIAQGRQAFIITPLVEDSASQQTKAAKTEFLRLKQSIFPEYRLDLLYGSMKGSDKDAVMLKFKQQQTDILVATSVIEIGIDFPNANVIIIEDADKFGLAQLHQLRGRVGRGTEQSYCFLFSNTETSHERLELFAKTRDGFKLATYDLATRGFGSLFGNTNQTGFSFKYGQLLNFEILHTARKAAQELTRSSPSLKKYPLLEYRVRSTLKDIHLE